MKFKLINNSYTYISKDDSLYLKGIAILIMVFLHLFGSRAVHIPAYNMLIDIPLFGHPVSQQIAHFCSICVHLYILLSGYGLWIVYRRYTENGKCMRPFHRIFQLLTKVAFIALLFYPISFFYPELGWHFSIKNCIKFFLGYEGNYEWWFLRPYIIITLLSPFLLRILDKSPKVSLILSIILMFLIKIYIYYAYLSWFEIPLIIQQFFILLPSFFMGALCSSSGLFFKAIEYSKKKCIISYASVIVILAMLIYKLVFPSGIIDPFLSLAFALCVIMAKKLIGSISRIFVILGKESMSMWLIHTFITIYYWSNLTYSFRYPILILVFAIVSSYIISLFISLIYNPVKNLIYE